MHTLKTRALAAALITAAGLACLKSPGADTPTEFRDAAADTAAAWERTEAPFKPIQWVTLNGGSFIMGTDSQEKGLEDAKPAHQISIKTFDISKTPVTVEQYKECVTKGRCAEPDVRKYCNWGQPDRERYPINCVDWYQANQYAEFIGDGARLPTEAEWTYAAKSGGKDQKYPWGDEEPTCDRAVMFDNGGYGCGTGGSMPVCSRPAGNTRIEKLPADEQLCDMAGNVLQWTQDEYKDSYNGAPADGGAVEGTGSVRVLRGGSFFNNKARYMRADSRGGDIPKARNGCIGFRLARDAKRH